MEPLEVESYAGFRYPQEPRRFREQGRWHVVAEIVRVWCEPGELHFQVRTNEGKIVQLVYHERADQWLAPRIDPNGDERF